MIKILLFSFILALPGCVISTWAQDGTDDTVRIRTRIVLVDVLVKDEKTGRPMTDLRREDFQVLDNGKQRLLTYFSRGNDGRKRPLALLLAFMPDPSGAGKYLRRPEVVRSLTSALAELRPEDEVAVTISWWGKTFSSPISVGFTRDRAQVAAALAKLPELIPLKPDDLPGTSDQALTDSALAAAAERPDSRVVVVLVTDSIYPMFNDERDEMAAKLLRGDISLNTLITGRSKSFLLLYPIFKPMGDTVGASWYGVPQFLAEQTSGEVIRLRKAEDYGSGLAQIIRNHTARYGLGFTLAENEPDDGQLRHLEVKVEARDPRGKKLKPLVTARRGYYVPKAREQERPGAGRPRRATM